VNPDTHQTSIERSIRTNQSTGRANEVVGLVSPVMVPRPDTSQQQIEVLDSQGRPIPWYHSSDAEGSRMTLTLTPPDRGTPTEIRYYTMVRALTDVSFQFA